MAVAGVPTLADFEGSARRAFERWICTSCAYQSFESPHITKGASTRTCKCPECGGRRWYHTAEPIPKV